MNFSTDELNLLDLITTSAINSTRENISTMNQADIDAHLDTATEIIFLASSIKEKIKAEIARLIRAQMSLNEQYNDQI